MLPGGRMIETTIALEARANLEWVAGKWGELRNRLHRSGGDPNAPKVKGSKEPPAPIDLYVSDLLYDIERAARFYAQVLIEESGWEPTTSTMPALLVGVAGQYGHFAVGDDKEARDFVDTAHELRRKVEGALSGGERARYVGPCPQQGCDGELYARGGISGELYARDGVGGACPECGHLWTPDGQFAYLRAEAQDVLMERDVLRAALVSMGYDVPHETIRTWIKRNKIGVAEGDLYKFEDALTLAKARGERKVSVR